MIHWLDWLTPSISTPQHHLDWELAASQLHSLFWFDSRYTSKSRTQSSCLLTSYIKFQFPFSISSTNIYFSSWCHCDPLLIAPFIQARTHTHTHWINQLLQLNIMESSFVNTGKFFQKFWWMNLLIESHYYKLIDSISLIFFNLLLGSMILCTWSISIADTILVQSINKMKYPLKFSKITKHFIWTVPLGGRTTKMGKGKASVAQ